MRLLILLLAIPTFCWAGSPKPQPPINVKVTVVDSCGCKNKQAAVAKKPHKVKSIVRKEVPNCCGDLKELKLEHQRLIDRFDTFMYAQPKLQVIHDYPPQTHVDTLRIVSAETSSKPGGFCWRCWLIPATVAGVVAGVIAWNARDKVEVNTFCPTCGK